MLETTYGSITAPSEPVLPHVTSETGVCRYLISARNYPDSSAYEQKQLQDFHEWVTKQTIYELDIETNVVEDLTERELYVIQFGDVSGKIQWVVDYASLPEEVVEYFRGVLRNKNTEKIIHNAKFEYTVIKYCMGVDIDNIFDTMLSMQVATQGKRVANDFYSLAGCLRELFGIEMSKEEQTSFTGEPLTVPQIIYAANDVRYMHLIRDRILSLDSYEEEKATIWLENNAVRGFGDILTNGFTFDTAQWEDNLEWARPIVAEAKAEMFKVMKEEFKEDCIALGFIQEKEEVTINWKSSKQKKEFLSRIFPELTNFTKPALKVHEKTLPDDNLLYFLIEGDTEKATEFALENYRALLEELGYIVPAGAVLLNPNSSTQRLKLFQLVDPKLKDTQEETLKNIDHPLIDAYKNYVKKARLLSSYGEKFYNFLGKDFKIRARGLRQILNTGRVSMSKPGIMTIPANEEKEEEGGIGNRYRKAFLPEDGWKLIPADYASQELAIIAYLANETVWLDAIRNGHDLHSVCAALVFGEKWTKAGGHPQGHKKPTHIEAKRLRTFTKTISFGLAYGGGPGMLSKRLEISFEDAEDLIKRYFSTFPKLEAYFQERAELALSRGFIETAPPFRRKRYFPEWRADFSMSREVKASIGREGKNTSIQGTGADGTKMAMILIKNYIEQHALGDKVRIVMMLHDAIVTEAREEFAEEWAEIKTELMIQGHEVNIPDRLILCDTEIVDHWVK